MWQYSHIFVSYIDNMKLEQAIILAQQSAIIVVVIVDKSTNISRY